MTNGWTGGQYSLYRAVVGVYLFIYFATLLPWRTELLSNGGVAILITIGALAAIGFSLGLYDRTAAVLMWCLLTWLVVRNPLIANPSLLLIGGLLWMHAMLPPAPYGSWAARARADPRGRWRMPPQLFAAAWIVLSAAYAYGAYTKIASRDWLLAAPSSALQLAAWGTLGLELLYAPLALFRRARPWIWTAMAAVHLARVVVIGFTDFSVAMVLAHLVTFDPAWVPARWSERRDQFFYDGTCGLCHRATRFVLAEDVGGTAFTFAPLHGDTFAGAIASDRRTVLPDSVVVKTEDGELLARSDAVVYILERLGGLWRVIAALVSLAPRGLRDAAYNFIARIRYRLFAREAASCPVLPADLRSRFHS
jgi:predicted DCC family thiol-disulfide oxidoreductase YuxK